MKTRSEWRDSKDGTDVTTDFNEVGNQSHDKGLSETTSESENGPLVSAWVTIRKSTVSPAPVVYSTLTLCPVLRKLFPLLSPSFSRPGTSLSYPGPYTCGENVGNLPFQFRDERKTEGNMVEGQSHFC